MPFVKCPHCKNELEVPENAEWRIKCVCGLEFGTLIVHKRKVKPQPVKQPAAPTVLDTRLPTDYKPPEWLADPPPKVEPPVPAQKSVPVQFYFPEPPNRGRWLFWQLLSTAVGITLFCVIVYFGIVKKMNDGAMGKRGVPGMRQ